MGGMIRVGVIDHHFPFPYGDPLSYRFGANWLAPCRTVADWGCGRGFFRNYIGADRYVGIDMGVDSVPQDNPFATVRADLTQYRGQTDGIFIRHVIEHNFAWRAILENAVASFTKRLFLAVFTPLAEGDAEQVLTLHGPPEYPFYDPPVPNLALPKAGIEEHFAGLHFRYRRVSTGTQYGQEHLWHVRRKGA